MGSSTGVRSLEHTPLNASLVMTAPRVAVRTFQDLVVWRKAHELVPGGLLVHGGLPENGNLRLGATNATSSSLGSGQHRRRISSAWESGQSTLYEYGRGFAGGESLLLDPGERPGIRRHRQSDNFTGRSQPLAQRLCVCHSGF